MKIHTPQHILIILCGLVCSSCCANHPKSDIELARKYQRKGKYEKAIETASTRSAREEDSDEASKIISESMKSQMLEDIDLFWSGKLSEAEMREKGYGIVSGCFDSKSNPDKKANNTP